ncbi:MAG TPA: ubiquinol oxidase subunit II [Novosphingobium sp.]|nr:ubiquinol oxidase subunit II [Novosphingobium sp.]
MQRSSPSPLRRVARLGAIASLAALSACHPVVLDPAGDIAKQQAHLVVVATVLMLIIIIPVMALTVFFAWKYRSANKDATYDPEWHHSTQLELVIWSAPLLIIIALGSVTWVSTHLLDPYRPLDRIAEGKPVTADVKPLEIDVVALDWKWLFIYPEQKIATVNELALPVDRPVTFRITSSSVMNSFYVPALAGQIYAMPGMTSQLHAVLNEPGKYIGFSANYSGQGFSQMRFETLGLSAGDFDKWADGVRKGGEAGLDAAGYLKLEEPTVKEPVHHFASVQGDLFSKIANLCVRPGKMCLSDMMAIDAKGGLGKAGAYNVAALTYDKNGRESVSPMIAGRDAQGKTYVRELCAPKTLAAPAGTPAAATAAGKLSLAQPARSPLS